MKISSKLKIFVEENVLKAMLPIFCGGDSMANYVSLVRYLYPPDSVALRCGACWWHWWSPPCVGPAPCGSPPSRSPWRSGCWHGQPRRSTAPSWRSASAPDSMWGVSNPWHGEFLGIFIMRIPIPVRWYLYNEKAHYQHKEATHGPDPNSLHFANISNAFF